MTVMILTATGSVGAVARYFVSGVVQDRSGSLLPVGTAAVNLLGAFVLGLLVGIGDSGPWWDAAVGFVGGFTTFSTWMLETARLGTLSRTSMRAVANLLVVATLGVAIAALGYWLTN